MSCERETEDYQEQNIGKDIKNTTQVQPDEEDECTVKDLQITKNQTGTDHVSDKTGETTTLVDRDVEYRRETGLKLKNVAETFIQKNLSRLSKNDHSAVMTPGFTQQGEELSSVSPPFTLAVGLVAVLMMLGTYPASSPDLWACLTITRMLRQLQIARDYRLIIVDLLTCVYPHRSGLFDFVTDIAYSVEVTEWVEFRIEEAVIRVIQTGHVPVLYVVHQDWVIF